MDPIRSLKGPHGFLAGLVLAHVSSMSIHGDPEWIALRIPYGFMLALRDCLDPASLPAFAQTYSLSLSYLEQ